MARRFEALRGDPGILHLFLHEMPKGGDIHSHLSGAIYAESYIAWAAEDGLCLVRATMGLVPPPCDAAAGRPAASTIPGDPNLHTDVVDAWSLRNWHPSQESGHRRFFSTFGRFGLATRGRTGDMLAEVSARAASQQVSYLE
ncbi:MAG: adenosine deaminase, partial [Gemmatimonadales bacterium]